jgi:hypothetical protein
MVFPPNLCVSVSLETKQNNSFISLLSELSLCSFFERLACCNHLSRHCFADNTHRKPSANLCVPNHVDVHVIALLLQNHAARKICPQHAAFFGSMFEHFVYRCAPHDELVVAQLLVVSQIQKLARRNDLLGNVPKKRFCIKRLQV